MNSAADFIRGLVAADSSNASSPTDSPQPQSSDLPNLELALVLLFLLVAVGSVPACIACYLQCRQCCEKKRERRRRRRQNCSSIEEGRIDMDEYRRQLRQGLQMKNTATQTEEKRGGTSTAQRAGNQSTSINHS